MKKILISHHIPEECYNQYIGEFIFDCPDEQKAIYSDQELKQLLPGYDALLCIKIKCPRELIDIGVNLKVIGAFGVGYDNIDWAYATAKGILVVNAPLSVQESTAELTIALMLAITRGIVRYDHSLRQTRLCQFVAFPDRDMMLSGKTLGIIGLGRIGRVVARKAQGLGMKVIYYDIFRLKDGVEEELDIAYATMENLLKSSDIVSIHMPYVSENHHIMNEYRFSLMKKTAYFINAARGPLVDEQALAEALVSGRIRGAALDVHEFEPIVTERIAALDNVVIVPHVGTSIYEVRINIAMESLLGITEVLSGRRPPNVINPSVYQTS